MSYICAFVCVSVLFYTAAEIVIFRIFYTVNRAGDGKLTLRELHHTDLCEVMLSLDDEPDINKARCCICCCCWCLVNNSVSVCVSVCVGDAFFSYEHFCVHRIWSLTSIITSLLTGRLATVLINTIRCKLLPSVPPPVCSLAFVFVCHYGNHALTVRCRSHLAGAPRKRPGSRAK